MLSHDTRVIQQSRLMCSVRMHSRLRAKEREGAGGRVYVCAYACVRARVKSPVQQTPSLQTIRPERYPLLCSLLLCLFSFLLNSLSHLCDMTLLLSALDKRRVLGYTYSFLRDNSPIYTITNDTNNLDLNSKYASRKSVFFCMFSLPPK